MNAKNNGGPAFPAEVGSHGAEVQVGNQQWMTPGMTLRDYFAAKAMVAIARNSDGSTVARETLCRLIARASYEVADAMLKAREEA